MHSYHKKDNLWGKMGATFFKQTANHGGMAITSQDEQKHTF